MATGVGTAEGQGDGDGARAQRADARRNRARILEAAWRLLAERGLVGLNMEEVARAADLGKGTLYRHYPTKECLLDDLSHEGGQLIAAAMRERIPPEADATTKLRAMITLCYDVYEQHAVSVDMMLDMWRAAEIRVDEQASSTHPASLAITRTRAILEQGLREGLFRPLDLDYAATAIFSLISPIAFLKQRNRLGYSRAEIEDRVNDFILHAVGAS